MQDNAIPCITIQYHVVPCNTMQYHSIQCNTMQHQEIPCNTMQYNAIPCIIMQYHACLITADGAYHCPVGSIWPFLYCYIEQPTTMSTSHHLQSPTREADVLPLFWEFNSGDGVTCGASLWETVFLFLQFIGSSRFVTINCSLSYHCKFHREPKQSLQNKNKDWKPTKTQGKDCLK